MKTTAEHFEMANALAKEKLSSKVRGGDPNQTGYHHAVRVSERLTDPTLKVIGMLHDIIEDSDVTHAQLEATFGGRIANAVRALSKNKDANEPVEDYLKRVTANVDALKVKIVDMEDNMVVRPGTIMGAHMQAKQQLYLELHPRLLKALEPHQTASNANSLVEVESNKKEMC